MRATPAAERLPSTIFDYLRLSTPCLLENSGRKRSILRPLAARGHLHQFWIETTDRFHQVALRGHHLVNVLIDHRHLVDAGGDERDAAFAQVRVDLLPVERLRCTCAAHHATS